MVRIIKSLMIIFGLLTMATFSTNAYFSDNVVLSGNQVSVGTWEIPNDIVKICHATGQEGLYQEISPSLQGIISGHVGASHHDGKDIIPPFDYGDSIQHFAGQNWDTNGQAIYNNNCEIVITEE